MKNILSSVRDELDKRYQAQVSLTLADPDESQATVAGPTWLWMSSGNLRQVNEETADAAALLDPEVGVVHFFIRFDPSIELQPVIIRSLNVRSQLQRERGLESDEPKDVDVYGSWRVVLVWLVEESHKEGWIDGIVKIREETGFTEELALDAIFFDPSRPAIALQKHFFSRLLLTLRKVLSLHQSDQALLWLSADKHVREAFDGFAIKFDDPKAKKLARLVETWSQEKSRQPEPYKIETSPWARGEALTSFMVKSFRSVKSISLLLGTDPVKAAVVFGPNGTGKSSLTEAFSLARFGTSARHSKFCNSNIEKDITVRDRTKDYVNSYLQSMSPASEPPRYSLDGKQWSSFANCSDNELGQARLAMEANILTQELSRELLDHSANELAARVLRNYSDLADHLEAQVDGAVGRSSEARQSYLRELGVSAQITRVATVQERLAERVLRAEAPGFPAGLRNWLRSVGNIPDSPYSRVSENISIWESTERVNGLASSLVTVADKGQPIQPIIEGWLEDYGALINRANQIVSEVNDSFGSSHGQIDDFIKGVEAWGKWLETPGKPKSAFGVETKEVKDLDQKREKLAELRRIGRNARERKDHLESAIKFLESSWSEERTDECPTCSSDLKSFGGARARLDSLLTAATFEVDALLPQINELRADVEQAQVVAAEAGAADNPVPAEDRAAIMKAFQWLTSDHAVFEEVLADHGRRRALIGIVEAIKEIPPKADRPSSFDQTADVLAKEISSEWMTAKEVFEEPNSWADVQGVFNTTLKEVVDRHLPDTVERLWMEIVACLRAASWINREPTGMKTSNRRGAKSVRIEVNSRLARYILNQSEAHVLGLAWFFSDYLLRGRFEMPVAVLDDPAQEMDETTFREFCRFLETLVRLHKRRKSPLTLILLLHQESRAIEVARATAATLHILKWRQSQQEDIVSVSVIDSSLVPRNPKSVLREAVGFSANATTIDQQKENPHG